MKPRKPSGRVARVLDAMRGRAAAETDETEEEIGPGALSPTERDAVAQVLARRREASREAPRPPLSGRR